MRQRVVIAIAISCEPALLIADEPTTALDVTIQAQILRLFERLRDDLGLALVFISHDLAVVETVCDDVLVMYAGHEVEQGRCEDVLQRATHPYSRALLAAVPDADEYQEELVVVPGSPPTPWTMPPRLPVRSAMRPGQRLHVPPTRPDLRRPRWAPCAMRARPGGRRWTLNQPCGSPLSTSRTPPVGSAGTTAAASSRASASRSNEEV